MVEGKPVDYGSYRLFAERLEAEVTFSSMPLALEGALKLGYTLESCGNGVVAVGDLQPEAPLRGDAGALSPKRDVCLLRQNMDELGISAHWARESDVGKQEAKPVASIQETRRFASVGSALQHAVEQGYVCHKNPSTVQRHVTAHHPASIVNHGWYTLWAEPDSKAETGALYQWQRRCL